MRNFKKPLASKNLTRAVRKCQSELNNRNTIKKANVATSSNRINKFLLVTVVVGESRKKLNKIILLFHSVILLKAFADDDCGT